MLVEGNCWARRVRRWYWCRMWCESHPGLASRCWAHFRRTRSTGWGWILFGVSKIAQRLWKGCSFCGTVHPKPWEVYSTHLVRHIFALNGNKDLKESEYAWRTSVNRNSWNTGCVFGLHHLVCWSLSLFNRIYFWKGALCIRTSFRSCSAVSSHQLVLGARMERESMNVGEILGHLRSFSFL